MEKTEIKLPLKTIYQSTDWDTYNNRLKSDGWILTRSEGRDYLGEPIIRVGKQVSSTISPLVPPFKNYIEYLTRNSLRYVLSPISDFSWLVGPFYDYYCLVDIKKTPTPWSEHIEFPFTVWCHGNDDTTWCGLYKTIEECNEVLDYLEQETDMPSLHDFLQAYDLSPT